tara:strand:+ start:2980 stop:3312 length:333 start_codon:yes stop_codon:yes gene_type:complete
MNLIDFAKTLPAQVDEQAFIDHLQKTVDLNAIRDLAAGEVDNLFDAAQYLVDFLLLVRERNGQKVEHKGAPYVEYRGPYIQNVLTNQGEGPSDFDQLETLGVGGADKYLA